MSNSPGAAELNAALVQSLREKGRIRTDRVAAAFTEVPRHLFLPDVPLEEAYTDDLVYTKRDETGRGLSSVSAPWLVAAMLERLAPAAGDSVLEVGSGGYNAALLRELVGADGAVSSIDIDPDVIERAERCLAGSRWEDVRLVTGDGHDGLLSGAPYDGIMVTVQATEVAPAWVEQLSRFGRLVVPLRIRGLGRLLTFTRDGDRLVGTGWEPCGFVRMRGRAALPASLVHLGGNGVRLRVDDSPMPDGPALESALKSERQRVWSGVAVGVTERTRPMVDLWLAFALDNYGRLDVDEPVPDQETGPVPLPGGSPATWSADTLAYLTMQPVAGDASRYEYGVAWHGPDRAVAEHVAEQLRVWDREHRGGPGPVLLIHPEGATDAPAEGRLLDRPGPRMVLAWS